MGAELDQKNDLLQWVLTRPTPANWVCDHNLEKNQPKRKKKKLARLGANPTFFNQANIKASGNPCN